MTATLHPSGQIILTPQTDEAPPFQQAESYQVMVSTHGSIMLRPRRKHKQSLIEHFRALRGLEIQRRLDLIPEPPVL